MKSFAVLAILGVLSAAVCSGLVWKKVNKMSAKPMDISEDSDLEEDARREGQVPTSSSASQMSQSEPQEYDYALVFADADTNAVMDLHKKLRSYGLEGCLYNDPSIMRSSVTGEMQVYQYAFEHSTVYVLYMSQTMCQDMRKDSTLDHVSNATLYKCLNDKHYNNLFIPYYPNRKKDLKDIPFHIAPISGLEAKGPYYGKYMCKVFGLLSYDDYKTFRINKSHAIHKKKWERLARYEKAKKGRQQKLED